MALLNDVVNIAANALRPPIGAFNELVFEVSRATVLTYKDMTRATKARYARHDVANRTQLLESVGRDAEEIGFEMQFNRRLGVEPSSAAELVRELCRRRIADYLILGNHVVGENRWVIESVTEQVESVNSFGKVMASSCKVRLREYVEAGDDV